MAENNDHTSAQPKTGKSRKWPWVLGMIVAAGIGYGAGGSGGTSAEPVASGGSSDSAEVEELRGELETVTSERDELAEQLEGTKGDLESAQEAETEVAEAEKAEVEEETASGFSDGMWLVGSDIEPGTYRTESGDCYWARLAGTSGEIDDIITNGNGAAVVTIEESDEAFESAFCGTWTLVE